MGSGSSRKLGLFLLLAAQACSPVYETRAALGHIKFLARRKSIEKTIRDPRTPAALRARLELVQDVRRFGFDRMGLRRSREYSTYSPVNGPALTWLVSGSKKTSFTPYEWRFFPVGTFPYKGHWKRSRALAEERRLEARGFDACVRGAADYNTGLWISDPVPSTLLSYEPGDLAEVLLHELTHSTVYYKDHSGFDEAAANFAGEQGARQFLAAHYGPKSKELADYEAGLARDKALDAQLEAIRDRLQAVYTSTASDAEKLKAREPVLREGLASLEARGFKLSKLNNAVILSYGLYDEHQDLFRRAYDRCGRDWARFFALLKGLDRRDPLGDLRRKTAGA